jgi:nitroreductase
MSAAGKTQADAFIQLVKKRRSVRSYRDAGVDPATVRTVLEAARLAPSAGNLQCYEIYQVTDKKTRYALARAAHEQLFLMSAPVLLVFCANPQRTEPRYGDRGKKLYPIQDATIACTHAMLAATALGLATVWVGSFDAEQVRKLIGAPRGQTPVAILPLAHPAEKPAPRERRPFDDLVHEI